MESKIRGGGGSLVQFQCATCAGLVTTATSPLLLATTRNCHVSSEYLIKKRQMCTLKSFVVNRGTVSFQAKIKCALFVLIYWLEFRFMTKWLRLPMQLLQWITPRGLNYQAKIICFPFRRIPISSARRTRWVLRSCDHILRSILLVASLHRKGGFESVFVSFCTNLV